MSDNKFGRALKSARENRTPFLSQSKLAERSGFDHSYVSRLESGARMPTREAVHRLATALGYDENDARRDALLDAAGFAVADVATLIADVPGVTDYVEAYRATDETTQQRMRLVLEMATEYADSRPRLT